MISLARKPKHAATQTCVCLRAARIQRFILPTNVTAPEQMSGTVLWTKDMADWILLEC